MNIIRSRHLVQQQAADEEEAAEEDRMVVCSGRIVCNRNIGL
jgi:hypothetical protein